MGYGKHFEDMYTGSMFGIGPDVFAVWGYVISNMRVTKLEAHVELNPKLMALAIGTTVERITAAIGVLESPDEDSRTEKMEGRRLVLATKRTKGPMQFLVVNGYKYRYSRDEGGRRESNRMAQKKYHAKKKAGEDWNEGAWEAFVNSGDNPSRAGDAWEPDGADKVLAIQKPMEKEGL